MAVAAADALAGMGCRAAPALGPLLDAARYEMDSAVSRACCDAVRRIEADLAAAPAEMEAAEPPAGRGTELEAAARPAGRGTEPEAAERGDG